VVLEENPAQLPTGRTIRREDIFVQWQEQAPVQEPELGELGTSEEEETE